MNKCRVNPTCTNSDGPNIKHIESFWIYDENFENIKTVFIQLQSKIKHFSNNIEGYEYF